MSNGSFAAPSKLREQVATNKAKQQLDEQAAKEEAEKASSANVEVTSPGEVTDDGAEAVTYRTVWGQLTRARLLKKYSEVHDMVREKRYFLTGYATQVVELGGMKFRFRTLKKAEQRLIANLSQAKPRQGTSGIMLPGLVEDDFGRWQLILMLKEIGGEQWEDVKVPDTSAAARFEEKTKKAIENFLKDNEVQRRLDVVNNWPEQLYDVLTGHCYGINLAYSLAIEDDLKNP